MPRFKKPCLLCQPDISPETHDIIWRGLAKGGQQGAILAARTRNIDLDQAAVRRHFEYHRPRQARPQDSWKRDEALLQAEKLTPRRRAIVELAYRLGAVDEDLIYRLLYWNGEARSKTGAQKSAARDLRFLLNEDFLFRIYPENMPGKAIWLDDRMPPPPVYFLGINGRALAEEKTSMIVRREDYCLEPGDEKNWAAIIQKTGSQVLIRELVKEIQNPIGPMVQEVEINSLKIRLQLDNFIRGRLLRLRLCDPNKKIKELRVSGLGAITFFDRSDKPFLFPFFYYHDDGRRKISKIIDDLLSTQIITKSGQVPELLPQLQRHQSLPTIVILKDQERLEELQQQARKKKHEALPNHYIICSDQKDIKNPLRKTDWTYLFEPQKETSLFQLALRAYQDYPIAEERLKMAGPRNKKDDENNEEG